jgi:hypothetical protein
MTEPNHTIAALATRHPHRITITIPQATHEQLLERSDEQGRSLSNLAAFLLERSLAQT